MQELYIDEHWTLFLDRDGVINKNIDGSYVLEWEQFEFLPGVLETMPKLAKFFSRIIVVSNQQCIGKGLITEDGLKFIHEAMINLIELNGGRIDAVYYAPGLASPDNLLRKPARGMALMAQKDFPGIDFRRSIMVGDKLSDMEFGKSLEMTTFYLSKHYEPNPLVDHWIRTLSELPEHLSYRRG